jgi:hypothetical protein
VSAQLTSLAYLNLNRQLNGLNGTIPSQLAELTKLTFM